MGVQGRLFIRERTFVKWQKGFVCLIFAALAGNVADMILLDQRINLPKDADFLLHHLTMLNNTVKTLGE